MCTFSMKFFPFAEVKRQIWASELKWIQVHDLLMKIFHSNSAGSCEDTKQINILHRNEQIH